MIISRNMLNEISNSCDRQMVRLVHQFYCMSLEFHGERSAFELDRFTRFGQLLEQLIDCWVESVTQTKLDDQLHEETKEAFMIIAGSATADIFEAFCKLTFLANPDRTAEQCIHEAGCIAGIDLMRMK